jgi:hypothetical protein
VIFKQKGKRKTFTTVDNRLLRDKSLSFKATGLLAFLLSLPDEWRPNSRHLAGIKTDGRDSVQAGLRELEAAGYLVRTRTRDSGGTFEWTIEVYETPRPGFPATVKPATGEPATENPANKESLRLLTDETTIIEGAADWLEEPTPFAAPMPDEVKAQRSKPRRKAG